MSVFVYLYYTNNHPKAFNQRNWIIKEPLAGGIHYMLQVTVSASGYFWSLPASCAAIRTPCWDFPPLLLCMCANKNFMLRSRFKRLRPN